MKSYDLVELAARNLRESLLRNSLTTMGISVGVASLVAMLSLGVGLQQLAARRLQKSGLFDTVVVTSRRDFRGFSREQEAPGPTPTESPALDEIARQKIEQLPNVQEAYPDVRFVTELRYEDKPHLTMVAGLPYSARNNDAFDSMPGHFFSSDVASEVILQKSFAEELLGRRPKPGADDVNVAELAQPLLGKDLILRYAERSAVAETQGEANPHKAGPSSPSASVQNNEYAAGEAYSVVSREQTLKIVGISDLDPDSMRGAARARVFLPLKLAQELHVLQPSDLRDTTRTFGKTPTYTTLSVRVRSPKYVQAVEDAVKKMGFNTFSIVDATRSLRQFFAVLDLFLGIFGSLALAVASLGIVNTLVMAILERRREIGVLKALGASDRDVQQLFFMEAGAMGLFGGVLGLLFGWAIGRAITFATNVYLHSQQLPSANVTAVPLWLAGFAIVFAILVSLAAGIYPASRAARLNPVEALRYE